MQPVQRHRVNKLQSYSLPGNQYIDLTLGASGSRYTAPADGWFYFTKGGDTGKWTYIGNETTGNRTSLIPTTGADPSVIFPALKGNIVRIDYNTTKEAEHFRFYYAVGSAPQS